MHTKFDILSDQINYTHAETQKDQFSHTNIHNPQQDLLIYFVLANQGVNKHTKRRRQNLLSINVINTHINIRLKYINRKINHSATLFVQTNKITCLINSKRY